jgi:hypothetical protein
MPSDYTRLAEQNIQKYGTDIDRYGPVLLANLYSDRTHFIYELLQNAEDALDRRCKRNDSAGVSGTVSFRLLHDRLEASHYGDPFDERDVQGICGLIEGTKREDLTQIGKFGIGFKSVYAYTLHPEIHSGDEHFRIDSYVRPFGLSTRPNRPDETLFVIPFDNPDVPASDAYNEVKARLSSLSSRTLLFLRHIDRIEWSTADGAGSYSRKVSIRGPERRVSLISQNPSSRIMEDWIVFDRALNDENGHSSLRVEVAFQLKMEAKRQIARISAVPDSNLVVFFPTEKETHLGFLLQGPYRTTPARDNVPKTDRWNKQLIEESAVLVTEALYYLKKEQLLDAGALEAMPIRSADFPPGEMFTPIFSAVRSILKNDELLPAEGGGFTSARQARMTRSSGLKELLSTMQLAQFCETDGLISWISDDITETKTPELWSYLRDELGISVIAPEDFGRGVDLAFLKKQSDDWIIDFYRFLADQPALWRPGSWRDKGVIREKPIIRLENGHHVPPFGANSTPNVYLSSQYQYESQLPTVKRAIAEQTMEFLKSLGLSELDFVSEIIEKVLPRYKAGTVSVTSLKEHQTDIGRILKGLQSDSQSKASELVSHLADTPFLLARRADSHEVRYLRASTVYLLNEDLKQFFDGNDSIWFLAEEPEIESRVLVQLGIADLPRRIRVSRELSYQERRALMGRGNSGVELSTQDYDIDGLEYFLSHLNLSKEPKARSLLLWNLLIKLIDRQPSWSRQDFFKGVFRWKYYSEKLAHFDSRFLKRLQESPWLPSADGSLCKPSEVTSDDLPEDFERNQILISQLKFRPLKISEIARQLGVDPEDVAFIRNHKEEFAEFKRALEEKRQSEERLGESEGKTDNMDYEAALSELFARPNVQPLAETVSSSGNVSNADLRRQRLADEVKDAIGSEPESSSRFAKVPRKVWEAKENTTRTFLKEQYGGKCQICRQTFCKRDGQPYFEGLYLVSHTVKKWLDRAGNVLCLCPTCCAKFLYGSVDAENIVEQVMRFRTRTEGGRGAPILELRLCGSPVTISYTEKHMIELQELLRASQGVKNVEVAD